MLTIEQQQIGWQHWLDLRRWLRKQCETPSPRLDLKVGSTLWFDPSCSETEIRILYRVDGEDYWMRGRIDPDLLYLRYTCEDNPCPEILLIKVNADKPQIETCAQYPYPSLEEAGRSIFSDLTRFK